MRDTEARCRLQYFVTKKIHRGQHPLKRVAALKAEDCPAKQSARVSSHPRLSCHVTQGVQSRAHTPGNSIDSSERIHEAALTLSRILVDLGPHMSTFRR